MRAMAAACSRETLMLRGSVLHHLRIAWVASSSRDQSAEHQNRVAQVATEPRVKGPGNQVRWSAAVVGGERRRV